GLIAESANDVVEPGVVLRENLSIIRFLGPLRLQKALEQIEEEEAARDDAEQAQNNIGAADARQALNDDIGRADQKAKVYDKKHRQRRQHQRHLPAVLRRRQRQVFGHIARAGRVEILRHHRST